MSDNSKIEWTDATWNPLRAKDKTTGKVGWHCELAGTECIHCYAQRMNGRNLNLGTGLPYTRSSRDKVTNFLDTSVLNAPKRWKKPRMVFVCSMTDLFGEWVTDEQIAYIFAAMYTYQWHTYQVLTKRTDRAREFLTKRHVREAIATAARGLAVGLDPKYELLTNTDFVADMHACWPLPNVWLGASAGNQEMLEKRVPDLLQTPAAIRFLSAEPLLGPLEMSAYMHGSLDCEECEEGFDEGETCIECGGSGVIAADSCLDWVIVGGESGPGARPMHPDWPREILDQCLESETAFFFKQWGEWAEAKHARLGTGQVCMRRDGHEQWCPSFAGFATMERVGKAKAGRLLDGQEWSQFPKPREVPC